MDWRALHLRPELSEPLYRQLAGAIRTAIRKGELNPGERLPPTRELAVWMSLNRTTVSAAYAALEEQGFIRGQVGRGSFVSERQTDGTRPIAPAPEEGLISFAHSRPAEEEFPTAAFRQAATALMRSNEVTNILQLGSVYGYGPLRQFLLKEALEEGILRDDDDLLLTSGCQQGSDLVARVLSGPGESVVLEDPVYHGLRRVFQMAGAIPSFVPVDDGGANVDALEKIFRLQRPKLLFLTPNFQNPTGATLSLPRRKHILALAERHNVTVIENDVYGALRYRGSGLATLKQLDGGGRTLLLRSFSKVAFPGLRVGWILGPRTLISRLADCKQTADLHSDQLSQAILHRFAASGQLEAHLQQTVAVGAERLQAVLAACREFLPRGSSFTQPDGGLNLWIRLPRSVDTTLLRRRVLDRGVDYLPGAVFAGGEQFSNCIRISFGGVPAQKIRQGLQIIGDAAAEELRPAVIDHDLSLTTVSV